MSKLPSPPSPPSTSQMDPLAQAGPPRAFACAQCHTRVAHTTRLVSTAYRGHAGKAALFSAMRNVALDPPSVLLMDSGAYTIQEFICTTCDTYLGWKFVRAHDGPERWKEGCFVLELDFVAAEDDPSAGSPQQPQQQQQQQQRQQPQQRPQQQFARNVNVVDDDAEARRAAHGLHRRTMSAAVVPTTPKGVGQGFRSLQATPRPQTQVLAPGRMGETGEYDGGPFWKPR